jgi:hypothetical protein
MENKSTRGGSGRNQGRRPSKYGTRVKTAITIRPDQFDELQGKNKPLYIDLGLAITLPALGHAPGTEDCLIAYHAISEAITRLERRRDYPPDAVEDLDSDQVYWTVEDAQLHALLSLFWDKLRQEPTFWEPEIEE